jgi:hypothetical protein
MDPPRSGIEEELHQHKNMAYDDEAPPVKAEKVDTADARAEDEQEPQPGVKNETRGWIRQEAV